MKRFLNIFILLVILGALVYQYRDILIARFLPVAPCSQPIPYELGTFDTQFNISKDYFLSALSDAEAIWEKPQGDYMGKELFIYAPTNTSSSVLKINLIYDYRQEATSKLASLGIVVKDDRASYDALKVKYTSLQTKIVIAKNDYDARVQSFNTEQKNYNQEVQSWNAKGGAPQADYNRLQQEKSSLDAQSSQLKVSQTVINEMVTEVNALVVVLNRLVDTLNLSVEKYNTTNVSRGESFEEGVYISDGINKGIDIYEFSNRQKLVRVLAHELGHALGLEHSDDPKAIMYKLNQGNNEILTTADLGALKTRCGIK